MEFFLKYQQVILRSLGGFLLLIGFVIHFWTVPQEGISQNDRAAANLARMEKSVLSTGSTNKTKQKSDTSQFLKELKAQQEKQIEYFTILILILGVLSLGYSFIKKKEY
ncbi:hypothetical protein MNB_SM-4-639 [hydrothermal vent metagenome]|uniref:Uncharacterized protein n=1 Tax=hydrothermal vent metagenome TaxID=652676 RepID=A0A1W1B9Z2_9ZZZZ